MEMWFALLQLSSHSELSFASCSALKERLALLRPVDDDAGCYMLWGGTCSISMGLIQVCTPKADCDSQADQVLAGGRTEEQSVTEGGIMGMCLNNIVIGAKKMATRACHSTQWATPYSDPRVLKAGPSWHSLVCCSSHGFHGRIHHKEVFDWTPENPVSNSQQLSFNSSVCRIHLKITSRWNPYIYIYI